MDLTRVVPNSEGIHSSSEHGLEQSGLVLAADKAERIWDGGVAVSVIGSREITSTLSLV